MDLTKLRNNNNWEEATIVFSKDNFKGNNFTELERSYKVNSKEKYFNWKATSTSLHGDCLDNIDLGVRLDLYNWKVEKIIITK